MVCTVPQTGYFSYIRVYVSEQASEQSSIPTYIAISAEQPKPAYFITDFGRWLKPNIVDVYRKSTGLTDDALVSRL